MSDLPPSTRNLLLAIWRYLSPRRRIQLALLLVVMLASGGAELVSLGSVLPFLAVLSDPQRLWQQPMIESLAVRVGFTQAHQLLVPATAAFATAAVLAALIRISNLWLNGRLAAAVGSDLSCEAYRRSLYQPYGVQVQRNSSEVITATTKQINNTVLALTYFLQLITALVVSLGLLTGLMLIDWSAALAAVCVFGSVYGFLAVTTHRELQRNSQRIVLASQQQTQALQEGLGAIRDVLLDGSQATYLEIYRRADRPQRQLQAKNEFLAYFPRYALEAIGMLALALLGAVLVHQRGSGGEVITLLGALALGAQRLLPAFQQAYAAWAVLKGYNSDLAGVLGLLEQPLPNQIGQVEPFSLVHGIRLESAKFSYASDLPEVLHGLDLEIRRGERVALIGATGSGKSTVADLLMGLLVPSSGKLLLDGLDVHDPARPKLLLEWRASIAHVPQSIYLADSSIAENIAFGVPKNQIDLERVNQAAEQAQIAGMIKSSRSGYETFVGERGIRLSGGQRQRIGIARALYKRTQVLILDEATAALDNDTEHAVMDAIEGLSRDLTIVIIAHRLTTVKRCDRIIQLEQGAIRAQGAPDQLLIPSPMP